ncbi:MAG: mersacidin/lichenicidin family type 2 lantibiotic [Pleurocapsa sp. MO_192.B19]|nr:mersacidin/lichenicidin family type 2 lantibiotic [Pleurocapsa sp. MO_192.B19]
MSNNDIIRAWKNEEYLDSLSEEQRSSLPENPAGIVELSDADMEIIAGGDGGPVFNISNDYADCPITNDYADCFNF